MNSRTIRRVLVEQGPSLLIYVICFIGLWVTLGWQFEGSTRKLRSIRVALIIGFFNLPVFFGFYIWGFFNAEQLPLIVIVASFVWKGFILFSSYYLVSFLLKLSFAPFTFTLFFTLFALGFFAIYLAWSVKKTTIQSEG